MSLEEIKAKLQAASDTKEGLLTQISDLYIKKIRSNDEALKGALADLHNSGDIDLVNIVSVVDKASIEYNSFSILSAFESTLPSLNSSVEDVLHCLVLIKQQTGRDMAIGGAYQRFCKAENHRPRDSVKFILEQSELSTYASFLSSSILSFNSNQMIEAIQTIESLVASANKMVRSQAYLTLGNIDVDEAHACAIWELLYSSTTSEQENSCRAGILRAIIFFGGRFPSYWPQIEDLISTTFDDTNKEVLYVISELVAFQSVTLPKSILNILLKKLANVSPEHTDTIDNIDHLLVRLISNDTPSVAVELLESILAVGVKVSMLDYFSNELLSKHQELLNHITTKWFLSGTSSLCSGVSELVNDLTSKDLTLEAEIELLEQGIKQEFVSHKAVGWLFTRPIAAASFILSIYNVASTTTRKQLEQVLYEPLLLSYPGELKQFFQSCIDKGMNENLCERLLNRLQAYHSGIEQVSGLNELMAPSENLSAYWRESNKDMQAAYEKASRSSFISQIATTQKLLYGNSSIYYVHQGNGDQVRQEVQMRSFSHSTEMPRLNVLDPENLDYTLRVYRHERLKSEVDS
ncbi:conserved hypothetical protein [Vibrio coralliirubri]|uniref:hypothetical protein n=1 Tax=Vibrio coralliirubri TaxID=1516159 RepID=UPI000632CC43|nr:hypothetical protein [Vibrio coralliirubri]CAH7022509.1 conserved hypothetical protein [Vibrio chagasii]CDU08670.1 conserved hypothetical protein [Vibrio coralliirubri]